MILAIVGMAGAGKSEAARFYEEYGFPRVYFGGIVLEEVDRRGLPRTQEHEKSVREHLREQYGMAAMAVVSYPKIKALLETSSHVLIDGLYSMAEFLYLKEQFPDQLRIIAIAAHRGLRYHRLSHRPIRPLTSEEAYYRDLNEIQRIEKAGPIAMADYTILNNGTLDELYANLSGLGLHQEPV